MVDGVLPRVSRRALLVVSHDLQILDHAITKVLHLDDGDVRQYKGTYSQYVAARAKDEDRLRRIAARQHAEIGRLSTLADRMRHSSEPCATGEDPRQACGTARLRSGHADPRCPQRALPLPAAAAQRSRRPADRRPHEGVRWPHYLVGPCVRSAAGRAPARAWPQRRRQNDAPAHSRRPRAARRRRCGVRYRRLGRLLRARNTKESSRARR